MNLWSHSYDTLTEAQRTIKDEGGPTGDQLLTIALVEAVLSVGQELSLIQDQGINPEWSQRDS